jgi:hypothetical protein
VWRCQPKRTQRLPAWDPIQNVTKEKKAMRKQSLHLAMIIAVFFVLAACASSRRTWRRGTADPGY